MSERDAVKRYPLVLAVSSCVQVDLFAFTAALMRKLTV